MLLAEGASYLKRNPEEIARAIRSLLGLRVGVPLDIVRWLAERAEASGRAHDIQVASVPPGVRVSAVVDLMKTPVHATAVVFLERMVVSGEEIRLEVRLEEVALRMAGEADTPVATLVKSGALDLSKPGNLVKHLPHRPSCLVEARDNRIVLDLMRLEGLRRRGRARRAIALATSFVTVHGVETDHRHVDISLRALPRGVRSAAREVRRSVLGPGYRRVRRLLPGS